MTKASEVLDPLIGLVFVLYVMVAQIIIFSLYPSKQMGLILALVLFEAFMIYLIILAVNSKLFESTKFCCFKGNVFKALFLCKLSSLLYEAKVC